MRTAVSPHATRCLGQITRQYIYLADMPIAVIDTPEGKSLQNQELLALVSIGLDAQNILKHLWQSMTSSDAKEQTTWLHTNHLGAPEAATDKAGQIIWQASYAPFGAVKIVKASSAKSTDNNPASFTLNLRLPGQYEDAETGLHYNKQRYYDPARGEYLSPDPLGTPDGPNGYSYVQYNPLKYVDPEGLILFAFDGTGNDPSSQTNVRHFARAYNDLSSYDQEKRIDGLTYYQRGPGTSSDDWLDNSAIGGAIAPRLRGIVDEQLSNIRSYVVDRTRWEIDKASRFGQSYSPKNPLDINVDVVGFSRGAAAGREFMNRVNELTNQGYYRSQANGACVRVILRFAGLFDTVLGTNTDFNMRTAIPASVKYVAHAVAVNEYRTLFPLESIEESFQNPGFSSNRIERGFIGAHSDIGGGYTPVDGGDLSDVALNWMVRQASSNGVTMKPLEAAQRTVSNPIVHDPRRDAKWRALGDPLAIKDRAVRYPNASDAPFLNRDSQQAPIQGMTAAEAQRLNLIRFRSLGIRDLTDTRVGDVDMAAYSRWLNQNYGMQ